MPLASIRCTLETRTVNTRSMWSRTLPWRRTGQLVHTSCQNRLLLLSIAHDPIGASSRPIRAPRKPYPPYQSSSKVRSSVSQRIDTLRSICWRHGWHAARNFTRHLILIHVLQFDRLHGIPSLEDSAPDPYQTPPGIEIETECESFVPHHTHGGH